MGVEARVLPMCDEPVATWVRSRARGCPFQEFMIVGGAAGPVEGVELRGLERGAAHARRCSPRSPRPRRS